MDDLFREFRETCRQVGYSVDNLTLTLYILTMKSDDVPIEYLN